MALALANRSALYARWDLLCLIQASGYRSFSNHRNAESLAYARLFSTNASSWTNSENLDHKNQSKITFTETGRKTEFDEAYWNYHLKRSRNYNTYTNYQYWLGVWADSRSRSQGQNSRSNSRLHKNLKNWWKIKG